MISLGDQFGLLKQESLKFNERVYPPRNYPENQSPTLSNVKHHTLHALSCNLQRITNLAKWFIIFHQPGFP